MICTNKNTLLLQQKGVACVNWKWLNRYKLTTHYGALQVQADGLMIKAKNDWQDG